VVKGTYNYFDVTTTRHSQLLSEPSSADAKKIRMMWKLKDPGFFPFEVYPASRSVLIKPQVYNL
jgi:hypothetical protein